MSGESSSVEFERAKLVRQTKGRGRWVYLPDLMLREAFGDHVPEAIYAQRIVLEPGTRQILLRLHSEP